MRNRKRELLGLLAAACAGLLAVLYLASPESPAQVGGFREAEELWAMEDERTESGEPLILRMTCDGRPLAYDAESGIFYCTLGMNQGEQWPQMDLRAEGAQGISVCFADDYSWDSCRDAIGEGYAYRLFAWTEDAFSYASIVFTGLPTAVMTTGGAELSRADTPGTLQISRYGDEPLESSVRLHIRGGVSYKSDKKSYRLDLLRAQNGKKVQRELPGFGQTNTVILNSCTQDECLVREKLGWHLWGKLAPQGTPFGERRTEYCELFVDDAYMGIYMLQDPVVPEAELALEGPGALSDSLYRTKSTFFLTGSRPWKAFSLREYTALICYYAPSEDPFAALAVLEGMQSEQDDARFLELAKQHVDLESMLAYDLFLQVGNMTDSMYNNLYIWAHETPSGPLYRFACWDIDKAWGDQTVLDASHYENWVCFPISARILNLWPEARYRLAEKWREMQQQGFTEEEVNRLVQSYAGELTGSGAWRRNAEKWNLEDEPPLWKIEDYTMQRFNTLERAIEMILEDPQAPVPFLERVSYEKISVSIFE